MMPPASNIRPAATAAMNSSSSSSSSRCGQHALPRRVWDSGLTCSFLASLIFSFSALFVKLTAGRVPVLEVCLVRSSICLGLSLILMRAARVPWQLFFGHRQNLRLLFLRGCCGACSMTSYYVALFMLPLGDAVTINLIGPPVTAIFARLLLKEPLGYRGMAGCVVSLAGVVLVARPPFLFGGGHEEWARSRAIGTAAGVVSAVLGGGSSMTIRLIGGSESAAVIAIWFHSATALLAVFPLMVGWPDKAALLSRGDGGLMLGVAATSFIAQLLSTRGLQRCQAAKAAAMGFTQVIYSNFFGAVFLGDKLTLLGFLGTALILAGVLLVTLRFPSSGAAAAASSKDIMSAGVGMFAADPAAGKAEADSSAAQSLLPAHFLHSDMMTAAPATDSQPGGGDAIAVVELRADTSLQSASSTAAADKPAQLVAAASQEDAPEAVVEPGLLAQVAASAAAALGGELCPAASTAMALELSRQVSRQLVTASRAVSQMSRQPSQWLFATESAFLAAPGLPNWEHQVQAGQQQQQELPEPVSPLPAVAQQQEQQQQQQQRTQGLRRALLQADSAPASPT